MGSDDWLSRAQPFWLVLWLTLAALAAAFYGAGPALLVASCGLLVLGLVLVWLSLGELANEEQLSLEEALEVAEPERNEQEKISLLRALKDLEQERRFGKITEAEFSTESSRLRERARYLLASLDEAAKGRLRHVEVRLKHKMKAHDKSATTKAPKARVPEQQGQPL